MFKLKRKDSMNIRSRIKRFLEPKILHLLPRHIAFDQNRNDRSGVLYKAWGHVVTSRMAGGGYYEFGIYKWESFRESSRIYQEFSAWMKSQSQSPEMWRRKIKWDYNHPFYAFDAFEGMPENTENNECSQREHFKAVWRR